MLSDNGEALSTPTDTLPPCMWARKDYFFPWTAWVWCYLQLEECFYHLKQLGIPFSCNEKGRKGIYHVGIATPGCGQEHCGWWLDRIVYMLNFNTFVYWKLYLMNDYNSVSLVLMSNHVFHSHTSSLKNEFTSLIELYDGFQYGIRDVAVSLYLYDSSLHAMDRKQ